MSFSPSKNALVFFAVHMAAACLVSGGALAEIVGRATTQVEYRDMASRAEALDSHNATQRSTSRHNG